MPRLLLCALFSCMTSAAFLPGAHAATAWDETTSGDFANVGTSPTAVSLGLGSNLIIGRTGRSGGVVDRDYFSFTLPAGWQLDSLTVLPGSSFVGASFIGVQTGTQVTVNPTGGSATGLLGWVHYSENDLGTNILPIIGIGFGAIGFDGALQAGSYAFWVQDTGTGTAAYRFDFNVSAVPEPAAPLLMLAGLAGLATRGWRRGR